MTWGFIWLMFVLKIPILMLLGIVWWAVRQETDHAEEDAPPEKVPARPHPPERPHRKRPRGPHGDSAVLPSPPRVRTTTAKARDSSRDA